MTLKKIFLIVLGVAFYIGLGFAYKSNTLAYFSNTSEEHTNSTSKKNKSTIQVALLLDTSSSMSGLIEQAKSQLWNILNELARTEKEDTETVLEIALYEYGNPSKANNKNQINQLATFTTDMDLISKKLFALTTNGGDEYCGAIIKTSLEDLEWKNKDGLKVIYIAGNEEFTQGPVNFETACKKAKEKGVIVNTIYCGDYQTGIREYWKAGATAGGGEYLNINHNRETVYVPTPYDDQINKLNTELNQTYIPFGEKGKEKQINQTAQDHNASSYGRANMTDRAVFKSSKKYKATDWDLVDAYKKDKKILEKAEVHADTLKNLSVEELEARIEAVATKRTSIQNKIQELDKKRRAYKKEKAKDQKEESLQENVVKSIKKQAKAKGYQIKE